jgi:hypothetical protein
LVEYAIFSDASKRKLSLKSIQTAYPIPEYNPPVMFRVYVVQLAKEGAAILL